MLLHRQVLHHLQHSTITDVVVFIYKYGLEGLRLAWMPLKPSRWDQENIFSVALALFTQVSSLMRNCWATNNWFCAGRSGARWCKMMHFSGRCLPSAQLLQPLLEKGCAHYGRGKKTTKRPCYHSGSSLKRFWSQSGRTTRDRHRVRQSGVSLGPITCLDKSPEDKHIIAPKESSGCAAFPALQQQPWQDIGIQHIPL